MCSSGGKWMAQSLSKYLDVIKMRPPVSSALDWVASEGSLAVGPEKLFVSGHS
jgi:hypothetical protein